MLSLPTMLAPSAETKQEMELYLHLQAVEAWKNLVFKSVQESHNSLDFCFHKFPSSEVALVKLLGELPP